mgnify:CR=1 FL=1
MFYDNGNRDGIKIDLQNVDTEITIDDLNRERAPKLPPRETSGVFGSDRFLDFIRNGSGYILICYYAEGHIPKQHYRDVHNILLKYDIPPTK